MILELQLAGIKDLIVLTQASHLLLTKQHIYFSITLRHSKGYFSQTGTHGTVYFQLSQSTQHPTLSTDPPQFLSTIPISYFFLSQSRNTSHSFMSLCPLSHWHSSSISRDFGGLKCTVCHFTGKLPTCITPGPGALGRNSPRPPRTAGAREVDPTPTQALHLDHLCSLRLPGSSTRKSLLSLCN